MPAGSVRALALLMLVTSVSLFTGLGLQVHDNYWDVVHLVVGFYFGQKVAKIEGKHDA